MSFSRSGRNASFSSRCSFILIVLGLTGCLRDDVIVPEPIPADPPLPDLLCAPFIMKGYTDQISYKPGDKLQVFFESTEEVTLCKITIYDISRKAVFSTASMLPLTPELSSDASVNGFNFPVAAAIIVPNLKSGVYLIENEVPFIVKTDEAVDITVVYASNTANAYETSGGKSLYSSVDRPTEVSFQRPIALQSLSKYCLEWFTSLTEFNIGYVADIDMDNFEDFSNSKLLVVAGHSEYWTRQARENFDRFVDSGGHALILSGNTMWWQVRYSEDKKKLICYRNADADPIGDPLLKTIEWNRPSLEYSILSSIGAHFPNGGYGLRADKGWDGYKIVAANSPLFEGLGLSKGDIISLPSLEYDGSLISGFDVDGYPVLDKQALNFAKAELLAFDRGYRITETTPTFIAFQKTESSGIVINAATTDWCSINGMGGASGAIIKEITYNALQKLLHDQMIFSE